jgi:hypothetical protein
MLSHGVIPVLHRHGIRTLADLTVPIPVADAGGSRSPMPEMPVCTRKGREQRRFVGR